MIRPTLVFILLSLAVIMMRGVASDWRQKSLESSMSSAKKSAPASEPVAPAVPVPPLQPRPPANLPDLNVGYVFNQERMLGGDEALPDEAGGEEGDVNENAHGITASIDDIIFVGSIIADAFSKALIMYPAPSVAAPASPTSRSSRSNAPPPRGAGAGEEEHAQLEVGDTISGYEVTEILPDKLIFSKGDERVEKQLFDPTRTRQPPPSRPGAGSLGGGPPRPPSPGGVLSTTIGGGGDTAHPTEAVDGSALPPAPPIPAPPPVPQAANSPTSAPVSSPRATQPVPVRRMVISRQPSPGPDTSRVNRQSRDGDEAVPLPPGMEIDPGGANIEISPEPGAN